MTPWLAQKERDVVFSVSALRSRWQSRHVPLACPRTPNCPGRPTVPLARFALATEILRCLGCGKAASAIHWRTEGLLRAGSFPRE
jgi:hypothetical protein